jgi:hypothetical protein
MTRMSILIVLLSSTCCTCRRFGYKMVKSYSSFVLCRPTFFSLTTAQDYLPLLAKLGPPRFRRFLVDLLPSKRIRRLRDISDVMHETSINILESKNRALHEGDEAVVKQVGSGRDIISILSMWNSVYSLTCCTILLRLPVKANMKASEEDRLHESEVLAQVRSCLFVLS